MKAKKFITPLIIALFAALAISCQVDFTNSISITYEDAEKYLVGNFKYSPDEIKSVDIEWVKGDITIKESFGNNLTVSESGTSLTENEKMRYLVEDGVLKIKFWKSHYSGDISPEEKALSVEIPSGINVTVSSISGNVDISIIKQKSLEVKNVSGNTSVYASVGSFSCDSVSASNVNGDTDIHNAKISKVKIKNVSGEVTVSGTYEVLSVDAVSGSVTVYVDEYVGMELKFDSVSGNVKTDKIYSKNKGKFIFGDGGCKTTVTTTSGNLYVK